MALIYDEISERIIASARDLARIKNTGKITVRDILHDLNMTNRVFYNRFHNIDEVLEILYAESVQTVRQSLSIPLQEDTDFFSHVQAVAQRTLVLSYESRQHYSQFIFDADSATNDIFRWWTQEIRKLIHSGVELGKLRRDLDEEAVSYAIWCFIRGFNADAIARNVPMEDALNQFRIGFGCFLRGIRKE